MLKYDLKNNQSARIRPIRVIRELADTAKPTRSAELPRSAPHYCPLPTAYCLLPNLLCLNTGLAPFDAAFFYAVFQSTSGLYAVYSACARLSFGL